MKRKLSIILVVALLVVLSGVAVAKARSSWDWRLGSLIADGKVFGLGYHDVKVELTGYGYITALCQNNGGKIAPGRNPIYVAVVSEAIWNIDENGKAEGSVILEPSVDNVEPSPSPKEAGCPSNSWDVIGFEDGKEDWVAAHIEITDLVDGTRSESLDFTCVTTHDGNGIATDVECTEVQ